MTNYNLLSFFALSTANTKTQNQVTTPMKALSRLILLSISILFTFSAVLADGYKIDIRVTDFGGDEIYLAYYLGSSQYVQDTAYRQGEHFVFEDDKALPPGLYLVVFPPDNRYLQLPVGNGEDAISLDISGKSVQRPLAVTGSTECEVFYDYVDFLTERRPQADSLRQRIADASDEKLKDDLQAKLDAVNASVTSYQEKILKEHPNSLTAVMIKANTEVPPPELMGTQEERQQQLLKFYQKHYFDNVPMRDQRLVRTPFLHEKIDYYITKLTPQVPDSISKSIDFILSKFDPEGEAFKYYLVHFLNTYAKSNIVGMDAVYVHLVEEYYMKGKAPWTEGDQLNKIVKNARTLRPILIGEIAPNLVMQDRAGEVYRLHDVRADYTVLYFWDPDCGHCKKSIPKLIDFYNHYKTQGVEVFAVCTKITDGVPECWEAIDEREMDIWINVVDPYLKSRFKQVYDVRMTPQVFVLDVEKRIRMKKISADQLPQVIDHLRSSDAE
jgi:hypothetical protein